VSRQPGREGKGGRVNDHHVIGVSGGRDDHRQVYLRRAGPVSAPELERRAHPLSHCPFRLLKTVLKAAR